MKRGKRKIVVEDRIGARKMKFLDLVDTKKFVQAVNEDCRMHPGGWFIHGVARSPDGQLWIANDNAEHKRWLDVIRKQGALGGREINAGNESEFLDAVPEGEGFTLIVRDCSWFIVAHEDALTVPRERA